MPSTAHDVGDVSDFAVGAPARVTVSGRALVVVRTASGFLAARDVCPHQAARLSDGAVSGTTLRCKPGEDVVYGRDGEIITCPWHGWEYDLATGKALVDPERVRVATYPARVAGSRVVVEM